jgi:hypothetical protein
MLTLFVAFWIFGMHRRAYASFELEDRLPSIARLPSYRSY